MAYLCLQGSSQLCIFCLSIVPDVSAVLTTMKGVADDEGKIFSVCTCLCRNGTQSLWRWLHAVPFLEALCISHTYTGSIFCPLLQFHQHKAQGCIQIKNTLAWLSKLPKWSSNNFVVDAKCSNLSQVYSMLTDLSRLFGCDNDDKRLHYGYLEHAACIKE